VSRSWALDASLPAWNAATVDALSRVRSLRDEGTPAFATIDAGPHVKVLSRLQDAARVRLAMEATRGVVRVIEATIGQGARLAGGTPDTAPQRGQKMGRGPP